MTDVVKSGRGKGWTNDELGMMLGIVQEILPIGGSGWEAVQLAYARRHQGRFTCRDGEAIKRKFMALKNVRKPTGDPTCPPEVASAKRIFRMIEGRGGVLALDDEGASSGDDATQATEGEQEIVPSLSSLVGVRERSVTPTKRAAAPCEGITRSGLSRESLEDLSESLRQDAAAVVLSQTALKRRRLDRMVERLEEEEGDNDKMFALFARMEERATERELAYRRERDELEARREEQRRLAQEERDRQRESRDARQEQLMMAIVTRLLEKDTSG